MGWSVGALEHDARTPAPMRAAVAEQSGERRVHGDAGTGRLSYPQDVAWGVTCRRLVACASRQYAARSTYFHR